jgi:hypothetical protein
MTLANLDGMESDLKLIGKDAEAEWDLITDLMVLSSRLVGYDWLDGEIHRQVVYYQTQMQEWRDLKNKQPIRPYRPVAEEIKEQEDIEKIEKKIISDLLGQGLTFYEIYSILRMPPGRLEKLIKELQGKKKS